VTIRQRALRSTAVLTLVLAAPFAYAQGNEKDADAERLFNEAKKLMEEKKFAEACPKLESAYRKDQQQGTLLNLAYCHSEMGSKWQAWVEFREAESKATEKQRKDFAHEKMKELEKGLSRLIIDPQTRYELTEVYLEDRRIWDAEKGIPFYAEPNNNRKVIFHAKGKKPAILLISVGTPKEKMQHIVVPEMADEEPIVVAPPEAPAPAPPPPRPPPPEPPPSTWSGQKTLAVVLGIGGVAGVAVGTVFGLKTMLGSCADGARKADGSGECLAADRNDASTQAAIATVGFIAGGALLAGAVVVWVLAPSGAKTGALVKPSITASVGPSWAGLQGRF
jgi:tetratricopeptide (TPR) repeat protein